MTTIVIETLKSSIATGQIANVLSAVAELSKSHAPDDVFSSLGSLSNSEFNLFEQLDTLTEAADTNEAVKGLLPALSLISAFSLSDGLAMLRFANRVSGMHRLTVAQQLSSQLKQHGGVASELGQALVIETLNGEGAELVWAGAFAMALPVEAALYVLDLASQSDRATTLAATLTTFFDGKNEDVVHSLLKREDFLVPVFGGFAHSNPNAIIVWRALGWLAEHSTLAMNTVRQVLETGPLDGIAAITGMLFVTRSPVIGPTKIPLEDLLFPLLRQIETDERIRGQVDNLIFSLLYEPATKQTAEKVILELRTAQFDLAKTLPLTLSALPEHSDTFIRVLTEWLIAEDALFESIRALLLMCMAGRVQASLDDVILGGASDKARTLVARRLLALANDGAVICNCLAVFAESSLLQPQGIRIAIDMLNDAFEEYPGATEKYLEEKVKTVAKNSPAGNMYRGVYANALRWKRVLNQLPALNELRPSDPQLFALGQLRAKINRDVNRQARQMSVFASFAKTSHLLQGRRFVTRTPSGPPQIAEMKSFGQTIELPSSERADPIGGMIKRARLLGAAK
ncbi:MAG: hypothetical protein EPO47_01535 [Rugosibacter sp.]|nr:MAG: hypothetical protein EPO47_01535 [Rugosibacter sp.]